MGYRRKLMTKHSAVYVIVACLLLSAPVSRAQEKISQIATAPSAVPASTREKVDETTLYKGREQKLIPIKLRSAVKPGHGKEFPYIDSRFLLKTSLDKEVAEPQLLADDQSEGSAETSVFQEIADGFYALITVVGFGTLNEVVDDSTLNWDNRLDIPRYQAVADFRPDFFLTFRRLELGVKPRANQTWQRWGEGRRDGQSDMDDDFFVNEWLARLRLHNTLFMSYGRENLQWGPSYLLSPSNPFNQNNGRNEPNLEVPGLDYGRLVFLPSSGWTISGIANTSEGKANIPNFEKTYAIKLDYTGQEKYVSVIPSYMEGDEEYRLGLYAGWSVAEPLLLYAEGSISDKDDEGEVLVGFAYTFEMGSTIAVEYFHQEDGCTLDPIERCFEGTDAGTEDILNQSDPLLRKNYGFLQFNHNQIWNRLNVTARWTHGFDDNSGRGIGILECELGDHVQMFFIGNYFYGDEDEEFGSFLDYSLTLGARLTF